MPFVSARKHKKAQVEVLVCTEQGRSETSAGLREPQPSAINSDRFLDNCYADPTDLANFSNGSSPRLRASALAILAGLLVIGLSLMMAHSARALPEYADRTDQSCGVCHLNPGGGGPRNIQGQYWVLSGKPDTLPALPGTEAATSPEEGESAAPAEGQTSPVEIVEMAITPEIEAVYLRMGCVDCHGFEGTGGRGPAFDKEVLAADKIEEAVREGGLEPDSEMPAFQPEELSEDDLLKLTAYLQAIGSGALLRVEDLTCYPIRSEIP